MSAVLPAAREGAGRDRGERGVQQHLGRRVGDDGQHPRAEEEPDTQRQTGKMVCVSR